MLETDFDTQAETDAADKESEARLPWESIDPDEAPLAYASPFASTAITAVEARAAGQSASPAPLLLNEFAVLENEAASAVSDAHREEQLADRAFFSDEKISIEVLCPAPAPVQQHRFSADIADAAGDIFSHRGMAADEVSAALSDETSEARIPATREESIAEQAEALVRIDFDDSAATDTSDLDLAARFSEGFPSESPRITLPHTSSTEFAAVEPEQETVVSDQPADHIPAAVIEEPLPEPAPLTAEIVADLPGAMEVDVPTLDAEAFAPSFVSRTIPPDAVNETAVTFSTTDSLLTSASELATLSGSFIDEEVEQAGDQTILVTAPADEGLTGLAEALLQPALSPQTVTTAEVDLEPELDAPIATTGGGWTIPLMCVGIGLIACCMVIPQGESNRRLRYEQASLAANLQQVQKQVAVNNEFLTKVMDDPTLAERLAGRQMKTIRKGQKVVDLKQAAGDSDMSPFSLVAVAKPADLPPYKPKTGTIANLCNNPRSRLYLLGSALGMVAVGLVMGFSTPKEQ